MQHSERFLNWNKEQDFVNRQDPILNDFDNDNQLWQSFRQGDKVAFALIYNTHISHLYNFCYQFSRNEDLTKDIIHDVFLRLRTSKSETKIKSIKSYLFRAVYTEWLKRNKASKRLESNIPELITFSIEDKIIEDQRIKQRLMALKERLKLLTPQQERGIFLFYHEGMSYDQVAEVLDLKNAKSARKLIYRALDRLRPNKSDKDYFALLSFLFFFMGSY